MDAVIDKMLECLERGAPIYLPSKFWQSYNAKNLAQLADAGFDNFKQTLARNYFTWLVGLTDAQFKFLRREFPFTWILSLVASAFEPNASSEASLWQQTKLGCFTRLIWKFTHRLDHDRLLATLEEPAVGNPSKIRMGGKLISQDLANSVLEYYSICEQFNPPRDQPVTVCELGAGYGRSAYVFLHAFPRCKYVVIDIPPALYVAQRYLKAVFPHKKVFEFRCFDNFAHVQSEFDDADIRFLLPHQAELLPQKSVDLFINISSLHEMKPEQIEAYFQLIDRLTSGCFYSKQWINSENPMDHIVVRREDYPVLPNWRELFNRSAKVQVHFFEAMYEIQSVTPTPAEVIP